MTKGRLAAILSEQESNPAAFKKDGYVYFLEALPMIRRGIEFAEFDERMKAETPPKQVVEDSWFTPKKTRKTK